MYVTYSTCFNDVRTPFTDEQFFDVPITHDKEIFRPFFDTQEVSSNDGYIDDTEKDK